MYLVVRRGAVEELDRLGGLAGAAAVACLRAFADEPAVAQWRPRPGKVVLRARSPPQWERVLAEPHARDEGGVGAPGRRGARGPHPAAAALRARRGADEAAGDVHRARPAAARRARAGD